MMRNAAGHAGHALVVGGTGMLRGVCLELAQRGWVVSVVARRHAGLAALAREVAARGGSGVINPLPADYGDSSVLAARIRSARAAHGAFSLVVCWIHDDAPGAVEMVMEMSGRSGGARSPCRVFEVVGSAGADPTVRAARREAPEGVLYRRIVLGFVVEDARARWLTHGEISRGILGAIDDDAEERIVGVVRPWGARPR